MEKAVKEVTFRVFFWKGKFDTFLSWKNKEKLLLSFCQKLKEKGITKLILLLKQDYDITKLLEKHCKDKEINMKVFLPEQFESIISDLQNYIQNHDNILFLFDDSGEPDSKIEKLRKDLRSYFASRVKEAKSPENQYVPSHLENDFHETTTASLEKQADNLEKVSASNLANVENRKEISISSGSENKKKKNFFQNSGISDKSNGSRKTMDSFRLSKFTIRVKLLGIISVLIITSLSIMIFIASFFFKRDIETQIQTNNSNLVQILGQKIEDFINQLYTTSEFLYLSAQNNKEKIVELTQFENPHIYAIAILQSSGSGYTIEKWIVNSLLMQQEGLLVEDFEGSLTIYNEKILSSFTGSFHLYNISRLLNRPVLLVIAPVKFRMDTYVIVFVNAKKIINDFPVQTGNETFLVNRYAEILLHSHLETTIMQKDIQDMPIIQSMQKSAIDNGLFAFSYNGKEYIGAFKKIPLGNMGIVSITETDFAFQQVFATQRRNLYILGIVLIIAIVIVYFFANTISTPLKELAYATERVEKEDYAVRVIPRTRDEVGLVAFSFNKMVQGLEEREKIKDAFGRFVNKEIAEKALRGEIRLGGEKKVCTIFFSDLRGFTAMSEKMKPEEVVEYLNRYFTLMVDCIEKTHGIVDKFIGDAIMATWGAVYSVGNDTENAINAALMMRKALMEFNAYNKEHNLPVVNFGCGINVGEVVSGQIGSEKRLEFTVIGDAVNLASRIEGLNKPFATDILISEDAYKKVQDIFHVVKMPAIKVKGKEEPQTIYCVLGRKDDPDAPRSLQELRKLVGITWEPQIEEGQEVMQDDKEEKFEILKPKQKN